MIAPTMMRKSSSESSYFIPPRRKRWTVEEELELFQEMDSSEKELYLLILSYLPLSTILFQDLCQRLIAMKEMPDDEIIEAARDSIIKYFAKFDEEGSLSRSARRLLTQALKKFAGAMRMKAAPREWVHRFVVPLVSDRGAFVISDALLSMSHLQDEEAFCIWTGQVRTSNAKIVHLKNEFLQDNIGLIGAIAGKYRQATDGHCLSKEDLIQEGCFGLMKAMERYDYARGLKFSTYSSWWVRHAVQRAVADKNRTVRIPVHVLDKMRVIKQFVTSYAQQFGHDPSVEVISKKTGYLKKSVHEVLDYNGGVMSLDAPMLGGEDGKMKDLHSYIAPPVEQVRTPLDEIQSKQQRLMLEKAMTILTDRERAIVVGRFGFDGDKKVSTDETNTLADIGKQYGLSRERIRQIESMALNKMYKFLANMGLSH